MGRFGSEMPARERRTASATAWTAVRCPISRSPIRSSMASSFSLSPCSIFPTGMPVHAETTSATSVADTSSLTIGGVLSPAWLACPSSASRAGISPYRIWDARVRSPSRWARSASIRSRSMCSVISPTRFRPDFSDCHRASSPRSSSFASASSALSRANRSFEPGSSSFSSANACMVIRSIERRSLSISSGEESISMRSRDAASSIRSMALSGSCRLVM